MGLGNQAGGKHGLGHASRQWLGGALKIYGNFRSLAQQTRRAPRRTHARSYEACAHHPVEW
ncbi:MAG TPA: hypothetical protein VNW92_02060 [Polyangiaceae bacterium]|jgi:hypothetical protein|nr:hypothetical protein [Polyangiaceae bacterium]